MSVFQAIILGLVQGFGEFLPISSSGHLILVPVVFGWEIQSQSFDIILHVATLVAVLIFFRKRVWSILRALCHITTPSPERRLGFALIIATIPAAIAGLVFGEYVESFFRSPQSVAYSLIIGAIILFCADRYAARRVVAARGIVDVGLKEGFIIGMSQVLAFIPGMSRSGITISGGLFQKFSKTAAAEFSFLMSIPVIVLAGASTVHDVFVQGGGLSIGTGAIIAGFVAALISGLLAIWLTLSIVRKISFVPFVWYRIFVGTIILLLFV